MDCEMASVHGLLSKIPERLSYEQVIVMAQQLFEKHPPQRLARNEGLKLRTRSEIYRYSERKCLYSAVKWYFPHELVYSLLYIPNNLSSEFFDCKLHSFLVLQLPDIYL